MKTLRCRKVHIFFAQNFLFQTSIFTENPHYPAWGFNTAVLLPATSTATSATATSAVAIFATSATLATAASATTTAPASRAEYPEWNFDPSVLLRNTSTATAETATSKPDYPEWSFDPAVLLPSTSAETAAAAAPSRTVKSAMRQTRKVNKRKTRAIDKSADLGDESAPGPSSSGRKRVRFVAEDGELFLQISLAYSHPSST